MSSLFILVLAGGCTGDVLPDESFLDRQRILAASIAVGGRSEVVAGEVATLDVLAWSPDADPQTLVLMCVPDEDDPDAPCPNDDLLDGAKEQDFATAEGASWAMENGLLGVLPDILVAFPVPAGAGMPAAEGRSYLSLGLAAWSDGRSDDERAQVTAVVVASPEGANLNPSAPTVSVDGVSVTEGEVEVEAGSTVRLVAAEADEPETWTDTDGEEATESFSYRWYSDLGDIVATGLEVPIGDLDAREERDWTLPDEATEGVLFLVVRDGRGGMAWSSYSVVVR